MSEPLCKYFGECGGCTAQHIEYSTQLENKKKMVQRYLKFENLQVFSGSPYGYRNRMDMVFSGRGIGFRKKGGWQDIVDVDFCAISNKRLNELITEVRQNFRHVEVYDVRKRCGTFRYAVIRAPQNDSSISFVLNSDSSSIAAAVEKIKEFAKITTANNILVTYVPSKTDVSISSDFFAIKGSDMLKETYLGKTFFYSAQGFFQNNYEMASKMHEYCNALLKKYDTKDATLLDMYGGVGCFGLVNADLFKSVTTIESVKECIDAAQKNIAANNAKNAHAIVLDAMHMGRLHLGTPLYVITDPPRSGMHEKAILKLKEHKPEVIIYISCNVEQLGKDIPKFKGYDLKSAAMFDLFPQTPHVECIAELVRKQS